MDWPDLAARLLQSHSGEVLIFLLTCLILLALIAVLPLLLRHNQRKAEMSHREHVMALEKGMPVPIEDDRARAAGRTALFVPMVVMLAAATVTCFLVASHVEQVFAVALAVWVVAGVVSLAAITAGVTLIGRLAQIQARLEDDEDDEDMPVEEDQLTR